MQITKPNKENGANLAEMSLVLPVALVVIYALIYFTFTMVIEGVAESSIHAALDEATVLPGLEHIPEIIPEDCDNYTTECNIPENSDDETVQFCCAVTQVVSKARDKAQNTFMGTSYEDSTFAYFSTSDGNSKQIRIKFPEESEDHVPAHLNPIGAYQDKPIIMELDYAIRPIFPGLPPIQRTVRAVAFYEVQSSLSYPIPVDCMGNAYGSSDYDLSSCTCLKAKKGKNSSNQCVVCDNGATPYIPGHPEFGVKPDNSSGTIRNGCWCPTYEYCRAEYGGTATVNNHGLNCECVCSSWQGGTSSYEGSGGWGGNATLTGCGCKSAPSGITGTNGETINFKPEREQLPNDCVCRKEDGTGLTRADCDRLFPAAAGRVLPDKDGCTCRCQYGGRNDWFNGSNPNGDGTPGSGRCDENVWGTGWAPQGDLASGATCECQCTTWSGGYTIVEQQEYNPDSGKCECTEIRNKPGETCQNTGSGASTAYKIYDSRCNCVCDKSRELEICGENAEIDPNSCQCRCKSADTFSGFGSCVATGGGAGASD